MTEIIKPLLVRVRLTKRQMEAARGRLAVDAFHARQRAMPEARRLRNAAKLAKRRELITAKAQAKFSSATTLPPS